MLLGRKRGGVSLGHTPGRNLWAPREGNAIVRRRAGLRSDGELKMSVSCNSDEQSLTRPRPFMLADHVRRHKEWGRA